MSKYTPDAIADADLEIARDPAIGGEYKVKLSRTRARILGHVEMTDSGTGTYTAVPGETISDTVAGVDLALVAETAVKSDVTCVVTLEVEDGSAVATFSTPARCADQSHNMPACTAVDFAAGAPASSDKVTGIVGLTSVVGGARGMKFAVVELPSRDSFVEVGCTTDKRFSLKSQTFIGINCGLTANAFVKKGMTQPGELTISAKHRGHLEAMARYTGQRVTAMLERYGDNELLLERIVFGGYGPSSSVNAPDGAGEVMDDSTSGIYELAGVFVAP